MDEENKKAAEKAMNLLLVQDRTKKELQERLYRAGFSEKAVAYALAYVMNFGYIDDLRYAENYISFHKDTRSKKELQYKLIQKGVPQETISEAFFSYNKEDEDTALRRQLRKRLRGKRLSGMEFQEKNKLISYLARKGYALPAIRRILQEQEAAEP